MHHGWEGHPSIIMINVQLSFITLASTLPVRAKRWKAYAFRCVQFIWNSSTIHACGSACRVYLELLWWCNIFSNKGCKFVVSAGTSCTVVQEEFLMLLMIMFPKAWLVLLLIPAALTIYPDTFRKSTLHSPEAGTLSSQQRLLSPTRILFSMLGEELISLSL